jgi:hypothetical protein
MHIRIPLAFANTAEVCVACGDAVSISEARRAPKIYNAQCSQSSLDDISSKLASQSQMQQDNAKLTHRCELMCAGGGGSDALPPALCAIALCVPACLWVCSTLTQLPQGLHISGGGIISSSDAISFPRATVLQGKASGAEGCPSGGRGERAPAGGRDDAGAWLARRTSAPPSVRPSCKLCAKRLPLILCAGRSWN